MSGKKEKKIQMEAHEYEKKAKQYFEENKFPEAIDFYSKYLALKKTSDAYATRALAHLKLGYPQKAFEDAVRALEVDAKNPKANCVKALSLIDMLKYEEAIPYLEKCLKFDPCNEEALHRLKLTKEKVENKENLGEKQLIKNLSSATDTPDVKQHTKGLDGMKAGKICSVESEEFFSCEQSTDDVSFHLSAPDQTPVKKETELILKDSGVESADRAISYTVKKIEAEIGYLPSPGKYLVKEMAKLKIDEGESARLVSAVAEDLQAAIAEADSLFPLKLEDEDAEQLPVGEKVENAGSMIPLDCTDVDLYKIAVSNVHVPSPEKKPAVLLAHEDFRDTSLLVENLDAEIAKYSLKSPKKLLVNKAAETITKLDQMAPPQNSPSKNTITDIKPENLNADLVVKNKNDIKPGDVSENTIVASDVCKSKVSAVEKPAAKSKFSLSAQPQRKKSNIQQVAFANKSLVNEKSTVTFSTDTDIKINHFTVTSGPQFCLIGSGASSISFKSWPDVVCLLKMCHQPIERIVLQDIDLDKQALDFFRSLDAACFNGVEICLNGIDFSTVRGSFTEIFDKMVKPKTVQFGGIKGVNSVLLCKALNSYPGLRDADVVQFFDLTEFVSPIKIEADAIICFLHNHGSTKRKVFSVMRSHLAVGMDELLSRLIKKFTADTKKSSFSLIVGCADDKKKPLPVERLVENEVTREKLEVKVRQSTSLNVHLASPCTLSVMSPLFVVEVVRGSA